ncbi:pathogenesis-related protein 1A-like [Diospyros lotus]|uniref:pathogenesis-related protein 1A-like n=1 Tax=Diospyros lotus TaxID=55363 RepID=UPI0022568260|nr:pathogenesis-related protein 1A-like [Diospyros lotus]
MVVHKTPSSVLSLLICLTIIVLALGFHPSHAQSSPQDYLDAHNAARSEVGVEPMVWDDTVAAYAESYASQRSGDCALIHSTDSPYGENIAVSNADEFTAVEAVNLWVKEKAYYDYGSNSCAEGQTCGHYTQVVWRNSVRLGCARVQCSAGEWEWFIICSYDPAGNVSGERPY